MTSTNPQKWVQEILGLNRKIIIVYGGGTGVGPVIDAIIRQYGDEVFIVVVVPGSDRGGSSEFFLDANGEALPPGDAGKALWALLANEQRQDKFRNFTKFRFDQKYGQLAGHSLSNLLTIAGHELSQGDPDDGLEYLADVFNITSGRVIYNSLERNSELVVRRGNKTIKGEKTIDEERDLNAPPISDVWLSPAAPANPKLLELMKHAWAVIIAGGSFYTSTCPNLVTDGLADAWVASPAVKIMITNLANESGHTNGWSAFKYVDQALHYLRRSNPLASLDFVIINDPQGIAPSIVQRYADMGEELTQPGQPSPDAAYQYHVGRLTASSLQTAQAGDPVATRSMVRHDPGPTGPIIDQGIRLIQAAK